MGFLLRLAAAVDFGFASVCLRSAPALAVLLTISWPVPAQEAGEKPEAGTGSADDLGQLQFEYEVMLAEALKPVTTLTENYQKRLASVATEVQQQGNLKGWNAVQAEIEAVKKTGNPLPKPDEASEPGSLVRARKLFLEGRQRLIESLSLQTSRLADTYRGKLDKLKVEYTQQGKLDDAIAAKELIEGISEIDATKLLLTTRGKRELKVRVQVDGLSHLMMRGGEIWFDHSQGKARAPGRHEGEFPTLLDDQVEWMPMWQGKVADRYDAGINLPVQGPAAKIRLHFSEGRGSAEVVEQPSAENDYTAKIEIRDITEEGLGFAGSDWMTFRLTW